MGAEFVKRIGLGRGPGAIIIDGVEYSNPVKKHKIPPEILADL